MRARMSLRPPTVDRHIAPTAAPVPHGSPRSMLPSGADSYGAIVAVPAWLSLGPQMPAWGRLYRPARAVRMGDYHDPGFFWYSRLRRGCVPKRSWGQLYPPPEAVAGPFASPPYHLRLGDDVAPGAPATSVTYPDILTSADQVAVPALSPIEPWTPSGAGLTALRATQAATYGGAAAAGAGQRIQVAGLTIGTDWTTLALYAAGGLAALFLVTRLMRR